MVGLSRARRIGSDHRISDPNHRSNLAPTAGSGYDGPRPYEYGFTKRLYGFWDPDIFIPPMSKLFSIDLKTLNFSGTQLWRIVANALEDRRLNETGAPFTPPRDFNYTRAERYSVFQAKITIEDSSADGYVRFVDVAGGIELETYGRSATIDILGPPNSIELLPTVFDTGSVIPTPEGDISVDSIVSGSVTVIDEPSCGKFCHKFTRQMIVLSNDVQFIEIPPGAIDVQIFATVDDGVIVTDDFEFKAGPSSTWPTVGVIPFNENITEIVKIPNGATRIGSGTPIASDRRFSIVFGITV